MRGDEPYVGFSPRFKLTPINEVLVREKSSIGHSGQWTKSEELANADNVGRGVDYVHADGRWRFDVAVACMKVLYDLHAAQPSLFIDAVARRNEEGAGDELAVRPRLFLRVQDVCARAGLDYFKLVDHMHAAAKTGYFGAAERVVPLLEKQSGACRDIAKRYALFRGEAGWHVTEASVSAFVRQFPISLRSEMIALLKGGTMIGRGMIRDGIDRLVPQSTDEVHKRLVFARFSPNSGSQIGITLEQERKAEYEKRGHKFVRSLSELAAFLVRDKKSCVVFVDDQFATGGQAHAQLLHWTGTPREDWPVEIRSERNIDLSELDATKTELLKKKKIRLAFLYGTQTGKRRIDEAAHNLGFRKS